MAEVGGTFCLPVKGHPAQPSVLSVVRWCNLCAEEVWVGEAGLERLETDGVQLLCLPCGLGLMAADGGELVIDPQTRAELHRLGYNDAEIDRLYRRVLKEMADDDRR